MGAAQRFTTQGQVVDVHEHGSGNVNDTFLVTVESGPENHFILQRINTHVFRHPEWIMLNMRTFSEHVLERLRHEPAQAGRKWEVPRVFPTRDGKDYFVDLEGNFWRAISFVDRSSCYETVQSIDQAREAGYALGRFQNLISDLDAARLYDTLEGFHITPRYLEQYDRVMARNDVDEGAAEVAALRRYCSHFVAERKGWACVLEKAKERGALVLRPIHGDPKVNNIMIDEQTGRAISLIDLDTVKPGLVHYDIGDCLRSCCNLLGEETEALADVRFETDLCQAILQGYSSEANRFLSDQDYSYMYDAIRLIAFELGLRFFTDYLEGNVYFKARHREHNLWRALVQFKLAESIEFQETGIRAIIDDLKK